MRIRAQHELDQANDNANLTTGRLVYVARTDPGTGKAAPGA